MIIISSNSSSCIIVAVVITVAEQHHHPAATANSQLLGKAVSTPRRSRTRTPQIYNCDCPLSISVATITAKTSGQDTIMADDKEQFGPSRLQPVSNKKKQSMLPATCLPTGKQSVSGETEIQKLASDRAETAQLPITTADVKMRPSACGEPMEDAALVSSKTPTAKEVDSTGKRLRKMLLNARQRIGHLFTFMRRKKSPARAQNTT